jgi:ABC-type uncharacterized transport system permease subunit
MHVALYAGAAALYVAASIRYTVRFARARSGATAVGGIIVAAGLVSHLLASGFYWGQYGEAPLVGLGPSLASLALLIALAFSALALFSSVWALGLLLAPIAGILLLLAILIGIEPTGSELAFRGWWLVLHIFLSFFGYAGWVVAAAAALMYLLQFRQLKHKRLGNVFEFFPPLETLDRLAEVGLIVGFAGLTLGIWLGWAWTIRFEGGFRWSDPKVVWAVLAWLAMLLAIWARFGRGRTARQAAFWNVAGFGAVSAAYLVAKLFTPGGPFFL